MLFFTVQESGGICRQLSSDFPSKIRVIPGGSGATGAGTAAMFAIDSCVVGAVLAGAFDCANIGPEPHVIAMSRHAAAVIDAFVMAAHYIVAPRRIR